MSLVEALTQAREATLSLAAELGGIKRLKPDEKAAKLEFVSACKLIVAMSKGKRGASTVEAPGKSPAKSLAEIIGEDEASPYFDFWALMKAWPRSQNQRPRRAAECFVGAVDAGTDGKAILEVAEALLASTQYVTRLDTWLESEGYRIDAPIARKALPTMVPQEWDEESF